MSGADRKPTLKESIAKMDEGGQAAVYRLAKAIRRDRTLGNISLQLARAEYAEILRELNPPLWIGAAIKDYAFRLANLDDVRGGAQS